MDALPRILIVEDEPKMVKLARDYLERSSYRVITAADGRTGLTSALRSPPDLVLLDLMLPDAQGGVILRRIRASSMDTRVAVITAAGSESLVLTHAASYNPDAVFLKPLDHKQLREWLDSCSSD